MEPQPAGGGLRALPSVTRTRRGERPDPAAVQEQVLDAVERLLADGESFTDLGIGRIADEAGLARSTFYGYFPDKSTLLIRLSDRVVGDLLAQARDWAADPDHTLDSLIATFQMLTREHRRHGALIRAVTEVAGYDPAVAGFWRDQIDGFGDVLRARLEADAQAAGARAGVDAATVATLVAWGAERSIALHVEREPAASDDTFARSLAQSLWALIGRE